MSVTKRERDAFTMPMAIAMPNRDTKGRRYLIMAETTAPIIRIFLF